MRRTKVRNGQDCARKLRWLKLGKRKCGKGENDGQTWGYETREVREGICRK
jgi:hypothetical protein